MSEWQKIDSAPKDGTRILISSGRGISAVEWLDQDISYWHVDDNKHGPFALRGSAPTHWMPLPNPPSDE